MVDRVEESRDAQQEAEEVRDRIDDVEHVAAPLKDNVLFLKHNLNARAVASLKTEFRVIEQDVEVLIVEMRKAIASSDAFIDSMKAQSGLSEKPRITY